MAQDMFTSFHLVVRWIHVFAGIIWIGHLYFFNWVNIPFQGSIDDATKKTVNPQLILRALWWFRWGAMATFLSGLAMFALIYMHTPEIGWGVNMLMKGDAGLTDRARWIMWGMLFGSVMWFNVWFIIWPAQKSIFQGKVAAENLPAVRKRAFLASRLNTFLSAPLLFAMLAPQDYGAISLVTVIVVTVVGAVAVWHMIKVSPKVGTGV